MSADSNEKPWSSWGWHDKMFLINSAYAALHGYGYVVASYAANTSRHYSWGKLMLLQALLAECPDTQLLFLDSDAYVVALAAPLALDSTRVVGMTLECGFAPHADTERCLSMAQYQAEFENNTWTPGPSGVVNAGVLAIFNPRRAPRLLSAWWGFPGVESAHTEWPWEQAAIGRLLAADPAIRPQVLLMDPQKYNGPAGTYIRHLYGP